MEDSILTSTKKILGVGEDDTSFDLDITTHINSTFATLAQVGIGSSTGFYISDESDLWSALNLPADQLGFLRSYMFLNVRMLFDPPPTSFHLSTMKEQVDEHLIRLSYLREGAIAENPDPIPPSGSDVDSATGTQDTPSTVWIMNHNLGFNPAGFRFTTLDGSDELEPESITYVTVNRSLATWPEAIAGNWIAS